MRGLMADEVVVHGCAPNHEQIVARFGELPRGVIVTYAPNIYVPSGDALTPALRAHEAVHLRQQGDRPSLWWDEYLEDPAFRLQEEVEAHQEEWRVVCRLVKDRNKRARERLVIARRLASPLYGSLVTVREALEWLRAS